MLRIHPTDTDTDRWAELARRATVLWNNVPSTLGVMAVGGAVAESYLSQAEANRSTSIGELDREAVAVLVATMNGCDYCLSAHVARSLILGAPPDEIMRWRAGAAQTPARHALLRLATAIVESRGSVSDADLADARTHGMRDAEIVDLVGVVAENTLGNLVNNVAATPPEPGLIAWCRRRGVDLQAAPQ
jgi:uncharacterized peroxidase-related enzyme